MKHAARGMWQVPGSGHGQQKQALGGYTVGSRNTWPGGGYGQQRGTVGIQIWRNARKGKRRDRMCRNGQQDPSEVKAREAVKMRRHRQATAAWYGRVGMCGRRQAVLPLRSPAHSGASMNEEESVKTAAQCHQPTGARWKAQCNPVFSEKATAYVQQATQ